MDDKDRIAILLTEYNTLRTEAMAVRTYVIQACSIGVPMLVGLIGLFFSLKISWQRYTVGATALSVLCVLIGVTIHSDQQTRGFTKQIRELEATVNRLAGQRLLTWETDHGWGALLWPINKQEQPPQSK